MPNYNKRKFFRRRLERSAIHIEDALYQHREPPVLAHFMYALLAEAGYTPPEIQLFGDKLRLLAVADELRTKDLI